MSAEFRCKRPLFTAAGVGFALALAACPAVAVEWFPSEPGLTFTYENEIAPTVIGGNGTDFWRAVSMDRWPYLGFVERFRVDAAGDVLCTGTGASGTGLIDEYHYDPPLLYLDLPLEVGKSWTSHAQLWPSYGEGPNIVTLTGRVAASGPATVPAGTFEVVVVELILSGQDYGAAPRTGYLLLHRQLGPVQGLVSWTGVVSTPPLTWGSLKAMWR